MADRTSSAADGTARAADQPRDAQNVRNVVLVGHTGAGKTTLVEALLVATGTIHRAGRVEDGTTVSDYDDAEVRQQRSVNLSVAPFTHQGVKVNLLDTPGYADFVGDLRAGLRAADCAVFVVSTAEAIDGSTRMLWSECTAVGMPRAVVLTKLDHPRSDYEGTLAACHEAFGAKVLPLYLPVVDTDGASTGLIGMISGRLFDYSSGQRTETEPSQQDADRLEAARGELIEGIIEESEDESLMDRYLGGEEIEQKVLIDDLERAVRGASFHPVIPVCAATGVGTAELIEIMTSAFPAPTEHPLPDITDLAGRPRTGISADPSGSLLAQIVKTTTDPYVGRISMVRMFSGTLRPDQVVHVSGHFLADRGHEDHDEDERIGAVTSPLGKTQRPVPFCAAGDICAVAKLSHAATGDTLSAKDDPLLMRPWEMPEPLLPVAIVAHTKADEDRLSQGLQRLAAEDPTVRIENNPETRQLVLWTIGEAHADVLLDRLRSRYGVAVDQVDLRVPLRETLVESAKGHGRHVKQSGGHGQYAVCDIEAEPLPEGSGFEFVDKVVGGAVPRQFIPSVEKGVRAQMEKGTTPAGYPMVDIRVTLFDGKAHSVDSSDMAFQTAGALALKDAAGAAGVNLLEPVDEVGVLVPDEYVGGVMGDLSSRRGRVLGTEPVGGGRTVVRADVPQIEIVRYAIDLRAMSHGTGTFIRSFARYEPMPQHLAAKAISKERS
ncbi:MAG: elongation factor G-like protein EF-G2 [Jiangellaceae bacterium]|nr:elongation factor G-like protein EF-G2 [Jiangellaceae bacterium]